ncbi:hydrogenase maturation protease [Actinotalea sp. Marseille-Q4924]|uniref:hydrogenase maturation protease n=1 Tax=Actinotalea sp. Marseille-Q4924 TaxID=2866571 RepID=UPI001CE4B508|nr:hydrogenase maturation protease [Actinotalea sp. Marseille-Q4924]
MSRLVIGLGCRGCGDDGVGPAVAGAVEELRLPGVHVAAVEDPAGLVPLWGTADVAVVVDAIAAGGPPGSITVLDLTDGALSGVGPGVPDGAWMRGGVGRYAFGLAAAVQLGRALHRLPGRLVLVGVEGTAFARREGLSAAVAAAVGPAARAVAGLVSLQTALQTAGSGGGLRPEHLEGW